MKRLLTIAILCSMFSQPAAAYDDYKFEVEPKPTVCYEQCSTNLYGEVHCYTVCK